MTVHRQARHSILQSSCVYMYYISCSISSSCDGGGIDCWGWLFICFLLTAMLYSKYSHK